MKYLKLFEEISYDTKRNTYIRLKELGYDDRAFRIIKSGIDNVINEFIETLSFITYKDGFAIINNEFNKDVNVVGFISKTTLILTDEYIDMILYLDLSDEDDEVYLRTYIDDVLTSKLYNEVKITPDEDYNYQAIDKILSREIKKIENDLKARYRRMIK